MRKINKIINIVLILILIRTTLMQDFAYALRAPLGKEDDTVYRLRDAISRADNRQGNTLRELGFETVLFSSSGLKVIMDSVARALAEARQYGYGFPDDWTDSNGSKKFFKKVLLCSVQNTLQHNNGKNRRLPIGVRVFYSNEKLVIQILGGGKTKLYVDKDRLFSSSDSVLPLRISSSAYGSKNNGLNRIFENLMHLKDMLTRADQSIFVCWYHLPYRLADYPSGDSYNPVITEICIPLQSIAKTSWQAKGEEPADAENIMGTVVEWASVDLRVTYRRKNMDDTRRDLKQVATSI